MMAFKNSEYTETCRAPFINSALFGALYYLLKGSVRHTVLYVVAALLTGGLSMLVYPFFTKRILRGHYGRKGFVEVTE
jgi:hypothetical protein